MDEIEKEIENILLADPVRVDKSKLVQLISENPSLECFNDQMHVLGTIGLRFSFSDLAEALVRRARDTDSATAMEDLKNYVNQDSFSLFYVFLLSDIYTNTERSYSFSNKVSFQDIEKIPESSLKDSLQKQVFDYKLGGNSIESVLIIPYQVDKYHYPDTETGRGFDETKMPPFQKLQDTRLLLSLARSGDYGVPLIGSTVLIPKNLSFLTRGQSWSPSSEPRIHLSPEILEFELGQANSLIQQFEMLGEDTQTRLRIALKRLNDSKIDSDWVNKFINIRVCLENIFINPGEIHKITQKLSTRIPKHSSLTKEQVRTYYSELSTAVHGGKLSDSPTIPFKDLVQIIRKMLLMVLSSGSYQKW